MRRYQLEIDAGMKRPTQSKRHAERNSMSHCGGGESTHGRLDGRIDIRCIRCRSWQQCACPSGPGHDAYEDITTTSPFRSRPVMKAASASAHSQLFRLSTLTTLSLCAAYSPMKTLGPFRS